MSKSRIMNASTSDGKQITGSQPSTRIFVDSLTLFNWLIFIHPRVRKELAAGCHCELLYVDAQQNAISFAKKSVSADGFSVERLRFSAEDIHDEHGRVSWISIRCKDLDDIRKTIVRSKPFKTAVDYLANSNQELFFLKSVVTISKTNERPGFWRSVYVYHVCANYLKSIGKKGEKSIVFTSMTQWWKELAEHGERMGFEVVPYYGSSDPTFLAKQLGVLNYYVKARRIGGQVIKAAKRCWPQSKWPQRSPNGNASAKLAIHNYGQFNLDSPEEASSEFFLLQSELKPENVTIIFEGQQDPLTRKRADRLSRLGIEALAIDEAAAPDMPEAWISNDIKAAPNRFQKSRGLGRALRDCGRFREKDWLQAQHFLFNERVNAWMDVCQKNNIKLHTSWFVYNDSNVVIAEAMRRTGGIMTIYQRSYEPVFSVHQATTTDVYFSFSYDFAQMNSNFSSLTPYVVATGYLGDFRFPLVRERAKKVRTHLKRNGAEHIICYLDENSRPDGRFIPGHQVLQQEYGGLIERLLSDDTLGLIIKPKVSTTLRERLGPISSMLDKALATGRCYVYEDKSDFAQLRHRFTPAVPAEAALAADIVIHGHLHAATAGMEAALAGVPTILLDRENWDCSPLHQLEEGKVVFKDWKQLWEAVDENRNRAGGVPGFGDWSHMLDQLDPFRDGRAADRMGTYLKWLVEGMNAGLDKDTVLADAAERYIKAWGNKAVQTPS